MSLREVRGALETWAERGDAVAVATLIDVRRSAPRSPGARFAVSGTGEIVGSVSSGCVEGDLHEHLVALLDGEPSAVLTYGISDEMATNVGLSCGGEIDVLVEPYSHDDPVWRPLARALDAGTPLVLLTGIAESVRSRRLLVVDAAGEADSDSLVAGSLGSDDLDRRARDAAIEMMGSTGTARLRLDEDDPESDVFAETFAPPPRLAIVGATPIAEALCRFASTVGFDVVVIDPREAFARADRFPDSSRLLIAWPEPAFERLGIDRFTNVVVLTHDAKLDDPSLAAALDAGCPYIGLLGGRRTQRQRREALSKAGYDDGEIARIKGPVGLDIGASSPSQIAISILAELIAEGRAP